MPDPQAEARVRRFTEAFLERMGLIGVVLSRRFPRAIDDVPDSLSDVQVRLIEQIRTSEQVLPFERLEGPKLTAFLLKSAQNRVLDGIRHQQVVARSALELLGAVANERTPETEAQREETLARLRSAIGELAPPYRELFSAVLERDVTLTEIARFEGIEPNTVHQRFRRGLIQLREIWTRPDRSGGD